MKMFIGLLVVALASVSSVYGIFENNCSSTEMRNETFMSDLEVAVENAKKCFDPFKTYCCVDITRTTNSDEPAYFCCDKAEFERQAEGAISATVIVTIVAIVVVVFCCVLCVACLRCTFCV